MCETPRWPRETPSGTTVSLLATIDFSENMLIVEGLVFVPDNRRYLTQRLLDGGVKRLQRVVAVKSRAINSNVTPIREDAGASTMSTLLLLLRPLRCR